MSKRRFDLAAFAPSLLILLCVAAGFALDSYPQYVIAIAVISAVTGVALVIIVGLARCITLAAGAVMAIGAYAVTLAMVRLGLALSAGPCLVAVMTGALAGWLIALPGTRFRGHNLAMVTLVFQSVCIILIRESTWLTGGAEGIHVPPPSMFGWPIVSDTSFLVVIGVCASLMVLVLTILVRGPFGKNLQAAAGNEVAAEAYGISVPGYITAAFVVSSIAIAFAGGLIAPRIRILDPDSFGIMASIFMLAYPIVGGMQSIWGGLIGGGGLRILPELLRPVADYQELFFASLVIAVVMFFPGGLIDLLRRVAGLANRRVAPAKPAAAVAVAIQPSAPLSRADDGAEVLLAVRGIDKHFDALHAVNTADLSVPVGGIHGLIGPNGAGKTSLFNIISGFLDADNGQISFVGSPILNLKARDRIHLGITRTFQHVAIFGQLSCVDNVIIGRGQNRVTASMRQSFDHLVGAADAAKAQDEARAALGSVGLGASAHVAAGSLSLGDQRRLEIARAIVSNPRLILLDEPVSGVAEAEVEALRELLLRINAERKIAMLIVEHNIPFVAKLCRTMSVMGAGSIVAEGRPAEVISLPAVRRLYFGEDLAA